MIIPWGGGSTGRGVASTGSIGVVCAVLYPSIELAWPRDSPDDDTDGMEGGGPTELSTGADDLRGAEYGIGYEYCVGEP